MNTLYIRHYVPAPGSGVQCPPCDETNEALRAIVDELSPKLKNLEVSLTLQTLEIPEITSRNSSKLNYLSFYGPEMGLKAERSIEDVLEASLSYSQCEGCVLSGGDSFPVRTLEIEGEPCRALSSGVLTDALIRVVFSVLGDCSAAGGCETCSGCGPR